jgi:ATP/maltotriose-dependent transcriptional regulator MalT
VPGLALAPADHEAEGRKRRRRVVGPAGLLVTKLYPPGRRDYILTRERLVERLRGGARCRLTVVAAPAGGGKTTLLATWREADASRRPVAWVSLDDGDNDPVVLWRHVIEALRRVCRSVGGSISPELVDPASIVEVILPCLVNELEDQDDVVLILDDFHRLSSGEARDSVAWLVDHGPATLQLVLGTRIEPAIPLAALRARGELLELRTDDLRFSPDEADALLNGRLRLGLSRDDVEILVGRTEGWPAGLYLAALTLGAVEDRHAYVGRFGASSRHVLDFLTEEVSYESDPGTLELMLRCSILDRFCGSLCDAVLEQDGTAVRLAGLARRNLFLVPLDDRGEWYRFHHLFGELLRLELERRDPDAVAALHRRAYAWHRDHGTVEEAVHHALEAGAVAEAADLVATVWMRYLQDFRFATILALLERFPDDVVGADARLLLVKAWVFALTGRHEESAEAIAAVERLDRLDEGPLPDGFFSVESSLALLNAGVPWGDVGAQLAAARRVAELEGPGSVWWPLVCGTVGCGLYLSGEIDEADRWFEDSAALALESGQWVTATASLAYRSLIAGDRGHVEEQQTFAEQEAELVRAHGLEEVSGLAQVALGLSLAARQRFDEALALIERGVAVVRRRRGPVDVADVLLRQLAVLEGMGERDRAAAVFAEARTVIASCPDSGVLPARLAALEAGERRPSPDGELSERELAVLRTLSGSLSQRDIGRELYLSHNTVHSHVQSIYRKLGVRSRAEAVAHARRDDLI